VTANGTTNGVLWLMNGFNLYALNAVSLKILYITNQAPNQRDPNW